MTPSSLPHLRVCSSDPLLHRAVEEAVASLSSLPQPWDAPGAPVWVVDLREDRESRQREGRLAKEGAPPFPQILAVGGEDLLSVPETHPPFADDFLWAPWNFAELKMRLGLRLRAASSSSSPETEKERDLNRIRGFLAKLVESSAEAIVITSPQGEVIMLNQAASTLFQRSPEEVYGKLTLQDLYVPGGVGQLMEELRGTQAGAARGFVHGLHTEARSGNGQEVPVTVAAALLSDDQGEEIGLFQLVRDERERRAMEAQLRVVNEALVAQEKQAALVALAGAAAHELNQPLTAILAALEMCQMRGLVMEEARPFADIVYQEAERMARLVARLGNLSEFATRRYVGNAEILDLNRGTE